MILLYFPFALEIIDFNNENSQIDAYCYNFWKRSKILKIHGKNYKSFEIEMIIIHVLKCLIYNINDLLSNHKTCNDQYTFSVSQ